MCIPISQRVVSRIMSAWAKAGEYNRVMEKVLEDSTYEQ